MDPTGLLTNMTAQIADLDDACALYRHVVQNGQVIVSLADPRVAMFGSNEYATIFSLVLEERNGVDLAVRYAEVLGLGPSKTEYGATIEASVMSAPKIGSGCGPWDARLEAARLRIVHRSEYEKERGAPPPFGKVCVDFPASEFD